MPQHRLPTADERAAAARAKVVAKARALAAKNAKARAKKAFDAHWVKLRRTRLHGKEMRSVHDLLSKMQTDQAKKAQSNIGQRLGPWSRKMQWEPQSFGQDFSGACSSKTGGGSFGYVATYDAMKDIYDKVK